jgi:hypothetical protein
LIPTLHPAAATMDSLFDDLDDVDSFELYYDSDLEAIRYAWEDSSDEEGYPNDSDDKDPFGGPDLDDPDLHDTNTRLPSSYANSPASTPASSSISLPLHHP